MHQQITSIKTVQTTQNMYHTIKKYPDKVEGFRGNVKERLYKKLSVEMATACWKGLAMSLFKIGGVSALEFPIHK